MTKKRRDKERDSSSLSKIAKVGAAALALGAGAAAFNNTALRRKLSSEIIPAFSSTAKRAGKEFRELKATRTGLDKRTTAEDIKQVWSNSRKNFEVERALAKSSPVRLNTSDKRTLFGAIKNMEQVTRNSLDEEIKNIGKAELRKEHIGVLIDKYKKKNANDVKDLALEAYEKIEEKVLKNKDGSYSFSTYLKDRFKGANFTEEERKDFLKSVYENNETIKAKLKNDKNFYSKAKDEVEKRLRKDFHDNSKRYSNTAYGKVDALFKKVLGEDFNSEFFLKGSRKATLKDLKDNIDKFDEKDFVHRIYDRTSNEYKNINLLDSVKNDMNDFILDKSIRVSKNGEIFSTHESDKIVDSIFGGFSDSAIGNLFGLRDIKASKKNPTLQSFLALKTGKEAAYELGNKTTTMFDSKISIGNSTTGISKLYNVAIDESGNLNVSDEAIAVGRLADNSHGKRARLHKNLVGTNKRIITASNNKLFKALDLEQSGAPNIFDRVYSSFTKGSNEDWEKNILHRAKTVINSEYSTLDKLDIATKAALDPNEIGNEEAYNTVKATIANRMLEDNKKISDMLNSITSINQISDESISSLIKSDNIKDEHSLKILKVLSEKKYNSADELIEMISSSSDGNRVAVYNKDLENIIRKGYSDSDYINNLQNISQFKSKSMFFTTFEQTNVMDAEDVVKREAIKEVVLREISGKNMDGTISITKSKITDLENIIQNSNLSKEQSKNLRYLSNWGVIQNSLELYNDKDAAIDLNRLVGEHSPLYKFDGLITSSPTFKQGYVEMLDDLASRHSILDKGVIGNINDFHYNEYNKYTFMKDSAFSWNSLSQINSINDAIKTAGQAWNELKAGRNDLSNYTTLTQIPQFFASRLSWGVEGLGLQLSHNSTGSTFDIVKNIALKRILPAAAIIKGYDYLDYESEEFTGTSVTGAAANTVSNLDLASRRLADATGLGKAVNWFKQSSVISEYWTGSDEYQNRDERSEWYKNGYSAVRGGRFWGFGSAAEYRGGNEQYYQPNYLRRAHSNWREVGIYGSADEKWSHSWLPTIQHPLSPIKALLDPYWLEKKNIDERPYPLTGKLFSGNTIWGAILNPTIGEAIKPVRILPEIKRRLGKDGRDVKTVLKRINERIKNRGNKNDDVMIVDGTDVRNARYIPYANPDDGNMHFNFSNGKATAPGIGFVEGNGESSHNSNGAGVQVFKDLSLPTGKVIEEQQEIPTEDNKYVNKVILDEDPDSKEMAKTIISGINNAIKSLSRRKNKAATQNPYGMLPDKTQGTYIYSNLVSKRDMFNSEYYQSKDMTGMVDKSLIGNYLDDAKHVGLQIPGIYSFLGDLAFGEDSYKFRYADASEMASSTRAFWDQQIGGVGGEFMEIARRFFPSTDKSTVKYNPLRNTMPEWLPEKFLTGDPFADIPKGEMRLPGKGYLTLNELHPDQFGDYGAFDRFKILADVAPTSEEYKLWRNIARNTIQDPKLVKEMEDIQARAKKVSGKHEFYDYRFIKNNISMKKGVIKNINGGIVELESGEKLALGGIKLTEEADLSQVMHSGRKIHYRTSSDAIKRLEDGLITNAVIYKKDGAFAENINKTLMNLGMAEEDKEDRSAIKYLARSSATQQAFGMVQEAISHANIPILHNKFMKIETARESWNNEIVYGSSFSTWDHPIKGFIKPMFNNVTRQGILMHGVATASALAFAKIGQLTNKTHIKYLSGITAAATNPGVLLGMGVAGLWNLGVRSTKIGGKTNIEVGAGIGATIGSLVWGWNNAENPLKASMSFAMAGESIGKYLKVKSGKGALIGAAIGLGVSAIKNPRMSKDMFRKKWIPKNTEKKYELDEYFDRLEYIKYKGLYRQAVIRASIFEKSRVGSQLKRLDENQKKLAKLTKKAEKLNNKNLAGGYKYEEEPAELNKKMEALKAQQTMIKGGKYTKAAVAYKKAMDSTIYGLSKGATKDEILAAIPNQYKDHFMNFVNETSKKERKKILKAVPEYLRKPLEIAWNEKVHHIDSNRKFFRNHKLPNAGWRGWKPNIKLKNIKMKTIQNEGMLLSEFGYYESEKSKLEYKMAPSIKNFDSGSHSLSYNARMASSLAGLGVSLQSITVEPTSAPGLWIFGDIKQTVEDAKKVGEYGLNSGGSFLTKMLF